MKRWKLTLGLIVLFSAGVIVGGVGTFIVVKHHIEGIVEGGPPVIRARMMKTLDRKLDLGDKQYAEIDKVLAETQEEIYLIRMRTLPELSMILEDSGVRVKMLLNAEQQEEFDRMHAKMMDSIRRFERWEVRGPSQ